ncbi:hypothetical protein K431DRAFT_303484 [Polychaeton citri CBS 116435]|uniref:Uncharacterized protein n=1 Tax=Polychaeton citri CBS 116435 TaxID=1314669 RepID=A0A9P4Q6H4_9PEZI|nr:hypothetical protein K431DRAFT_303484 [Polychaeton citri CBS 116435]
MATTENLTQRDKDCLIAYFSVAKTQRAKGIDWKAVSKKSSFTTGKYARDTFNAIKKKFAGGIFDLTSKHLELLKAIAVNSTTSSVDWAQVAKTGNFTTAKYARDSWAGVKNKLTSAPADISDEASRKEERAAKNVAQANVEGKKTTLRKRKANLVEVEAPSKRTKAHQAQEAYQATFDGLIAEHNVDTEIEDSIFN